jgi:outer membrane protein assembly factor BamB
MRHSTARFSAFAALFLVMLASAGAWSQGASAPDVVWPTYHMDAFRTGQNPDSKDISNPASMNLIWVFPRGVGRLPQDEMKSIVDDWNNNKQFFSGNLKWEDTLSSEESYDGHFFWTPAVPRGVSGSKATTVEWRFPVGELEPGTYQIMVWVPSDYGRYDQNGKPLYHNTSQAEYTIYDDSGKTTIKFDQREGGYWKLLTTRSFSFKESGRDYKVQLSSMTDDAKDFIEHDRTIVVADAIRFVPGTGQEIYSSPASGVVPWSCKWEYKDSNYPDQKYNFGDASGTWSGEIPVTYLGTVESPLGKDAESPETGTIYCVNSITPYTRALDDTNWGGASDWKEAMGLAEFLGTPVWKYPRDLDARLNGSWVGEPTASANKWFVPPNDLEGPIQGGIYSSPVIVKTGIAEHPMVCVITAGDSQTYALDAVTGELLWKGPGVTQTEGTPAGWTPEQRGTAFGGKFHRVSCVPESGTPTTVTWEFNRTTATGKNARQVAGEPVNGGWWYSVYAWIPPKTTTDPLRARDATYTIDAEGATTAAEVRIDQGLASNQGRWVKLGGSYYKVNSVTLTNVTRALFGRENAGDFSVVADAVMIVPETIGPFTYSSPVVNVENAATDIGSRVYVVTAAGRALSFDLQPPVAPDDLPIGQCNWIYPSVRASDSAQDEDAPGLGYVGASPTFEKANDGTLYIASLDGYLYAIQNCDPLGASTVAPSRKWRFPDADDIEDPAGFTSSPTLDKGNRQIFIGSTGGEFYCINTSDGTVKWRYPEAVGQGQVPKLPLGAFRYSTAALGYDDQGTHRVWVGSTDGKIYSFVASGPTAGQRMWVEYDANGNGTPRGGGYYAEPNVLAPIQASVALAGDTSSMDLIMYVGDMKEKGVLHWFSATNGATKQYAWDDPNDPDDEPKVYKGWRTEGQLFSSPNITHLNPAPSVNFSYVYTGCGDGRLYAFSRHGGAWGGRWAQIGDWPFEGQPNDNSAKERQLEPDEYVQFDIFEADFYEKSKSEDPNRKSGNDYECVGDDTWIVSAEMKAPTKAFASDDEIKNYLRDEARKRRRHVFAKTARALSSSNPNSALYFEWGETLYLILWNLPDMNTLYGSNEASKKANIRFNLANTSAGASAGSQIRLASNCQVLKEYNVLDGTKKTQTNPVTAPPLLDFSGDEVKRCYALAQIDIRGTGSRPPSPGPGWVLTAEVRQKSKTAQGAETFTQLTIPLAQLKAGTDPPEPRFNGTEIAPQLLGINNPLAIKDDADRPEIPGSGVELAWPTTGFVVTNTTRNDPDAHFNGNAVIVYSSTSSEPGFDNSRVPTLNLDIFDSMGERGVAHGTSSRVGWLGVMDRSAVGLTPLPGSNPPKYATLDRFRIEAGDLRWRGGEQAITDSGGMRLPWELGIGSVDYPNIYKRSQEYRKQSDDGDPSRQATVLPGIVPNSSSPKSYVGSLMRPDTVQVSVEVPRFQPANTTGYSRTMQAYIDSDGDQRWDSGDTVYGRPSTYQEAYRRFRVGLRVPPDPRLEIDEQLIDIGQAPHGLGQGFDFVPYNTNPDIRQWFKKITVKNAGNVNLYNLYVARNNPLFVLKDALSLGIAPGAVPQIPGTEIRTSIDPEMPADPRLASLKLEPFTTADPNPARGVPFGYTITKPRVGDPDPSILTIPDRRKWDADYRYSGGPGDVYTQDAAAQALVAAGWAPTVEEAKKKLPLEPEVSVAVPISQQIGTYVAPFVPVMGTFGGNANPAVAFSDPSFGLKVTVRENRLTGDQSPGVLPQIDDGPFPKVGDGTPAAFRDPTTGRVHLFYSSNRLWDPAFQTYYPNWSDPDDPNHQLFAKAPWLIYESTLDYSPTGGFTLPANGSGGPRRWWQFPGGTPFLPSISPAAQWPPLIGAPAGATVMDWVSASGQVLQSVNHFSPTIAENRDLMASAPDSNRGLTWLGWAGTANVRDPSGAVTREHRIFYTDATHGDVTSGGAKIYSIEHQPGMEKRYPSLAVFNKPSGEPRMWCFWQGGENGRWSIFYSTNDRAPDFPGRSASGMDLWAPDTRLRTPDCLSSVGSPNAVHREFWRNRGGGSDGAKKDLFDMVYSGVTKLSESSDILLSRYAAVASSDPARYASAQPGQIAQPLPRVYGEKLERDSKHGFFTSKHLAWIRLGRAGYDNMQRLLTNQADRDLILSDHRGRPAHMLYMADLDALALDPAKGAVVTGAMYNLPYIWVRFPDGTEVYATDKVVPEFDDATGVCIYKYPDGSPAADLLGQMLVDYSAGIVRFTKPLPETRNADGTFVTPEVFADYTPQTWRLTTDRAVDNSPRAFIERTQMTRQANPGLSEDWLSGPNRDVDRLWVLWRKAGTGVNSSTVFWKTYRVGIDISSFKDANGEPLYPPIPVVRATDAHGTRYFKTDTITVSGALGPWELDATGTKIYFSQVDERYTSLIKSGRMNYLGDPAPSADVAVNQGGLWVPKPIIIQYADADGKDRKIEAYDVSWIEEAPEQSLFGFVGDSSVNEGSVYAFADPDPRYWQPNAAGGTWQPLLSSKIWVFWTSTRSGTSDLCWATLTPTFSAR